MGDWDPNVVQQVGNIIQTGMQAGQNKRAFKRSAEFTREMFDATNAYNHPVQQMARLKEAGLNPALMYGKSGGTGQATNPPGQTMQPATVPDLNAGLGYAELQLIKSNIKNNESAQNLNTLKGATEAQNAALIKEQTGKTAAEKVTAQEQSKLASELTNASLQAQLASTQNKIANTEGTKAATRVTKSNARVAEATETQRIQKATAELKDITAGVNLKKYQADKTYAETVNKKISTLYDDYKLSAALRGAPIDQGPTGFFSGMVNLMSGWLGQGKPPGIDSQLWRDYQEYTNKNKK